MLERIVRPGRDGCSYIRVGYLSGELRSELELCLRNGSKCRGGVLAATLFVNEGISKKTRD